jgi:hypothetical protein
MNAQVKVGINFNIGSQPVWGPTGYDYVEYYYLPDIDVYYNVPHRRYYYFERGGWRSSPYLPDRYRDYDAFHSYKVVINERDPWRHNEVYRERYSGYRGRHDQELIRDSRDSRYFVNKEHPEHNRWVQEQKHANGHHGHKDNGRHGNRGGEDRRDNDRH